MPNRILRDWTDSERIDQLTPLAERFFTRLIMKVDDYGRYNANMKYLKSTLFPLRTDVTENNISDYLSECSRSELITLYCIASKEYLQIENFKQTLRQKHLKYPEPPALTPHVTHTHSTCIAIDVPETNRNESETETKGKDEIASATHLLRTNTTEDITLKFKEFNTWLLNHAPSLLKWKEPLTIDQYQKIREAYPGELSLVSTTISAMHNKVGAEKKYKSVYLTLKSWIRNAAK